jgi:hypothetical protein
MTLSWGIKPSNVPTGHKLRRAHREWLAPPDPFVNYDTPLESHHERTTAWFTQGDTFADWKQSALLLWVYGKRRPSRPFPLCCLLIDLRIHKRALAKVFLRTSLFNRFDCSNLYDLMSTSSAVIQNIDGFFNTGSAHMYGVDFFSTLRTQESRMSEPYFHPSSSNSPTNSPLSVTEFLPNTRYMQLRCIVVWDCNSTMQLYLTSHHFSTLLTSCLVLPLTKKELCTISSRLRPQMLEMRYSRMHCSCDFP